MLLLPLLMLMLLLPPLLLLPLPPQVYDARALRVIVDDEGGAALQAAIFTCYKLVGVVHSIWKPIRNEYDDYVANPKASGYQALHTGVSP